MKRILASLLLAAPLAAQQPVAPTNEPVGSRRGREAGDYVITNSWELGWRFREINGNESKYRSDVNYGNGVRLLGGRLAVNSKDGHGRLFDEIVLTVLGLGNDPYENVMLRAQKNRWYTYDFLWRSIDYYNPAIPISFGQHFMDTTRHLQDHDLILLPQSKIRFFVGFSRVSQSGPGLTTVQEFDRRGDEFPLATNIRQRQNLFRAGNEFRLFGVRVNWVRAWEMYSEDTRDSLNRFEPGNNPADQTTLTQFQRTQPYQGTTPSWRVNLFREQGKLWALNGRFTNSAGRRDFTFNETAIGTDRLGSALNRQVLVGGTAQRPVTSANLTVSLFPTETLTITNHTLFHSTRMVGNAQYRELFNANLSQNVVNFQYLGIQNITNVTDANWRIRPWVALYGSYQYADRQIKSTESASIEQDRFTVTSEQSNRLQAGTAGVQFKAWKALSIAVDGELGRNTQPIYPISEKNYQALNGRIRYRAKSLTLSALARSNYNLNSVSLFAHSSRARQYHVDGSWTGPGGLSIEAGWSKLHLNTATGIAYFVASELITGEQSLYISNLHALNIGIRGSIRQRVDWYVGYSRTQDTGDDGPRGGPPLPAFRVAQTFPMTFDSPQARVSVRLTERLRWNAGYQFYRYLETILPSQNYRANTGYTSVLWSF